jgi:hypothetical protein
MQKHALDILDGGFSLQFLPDKCFIEERLIPHPMFKKLGAVGIPDIRVIVFHHIPVMAMMRFPTEESGGKANLTLGAICFGIDLRTGITTSAYSKKGMISTIPSTKIKVRGIKIPMWDEIMLMAAQTQSVSGLGYAGVDIVIDKNGQPNILEVNALLKKLPVDFRTEVLCVKLPLALTQLPLQQTRVLPRLLIQQSVPITLKSPER